MTVNISKPSINIREKLAELDKPSGIAGEAVLRADSVQEIRNSIGAGRKNLIINGGMNVWQRGTTASQAGQTAYISADRWLTYIDTSSTVWLSKVDFTKGQTEVEGNPESYAKFDWLGTGSTALKVLEQRVENVIPVSGVPITLSFYARTEQADDVEIKFIQDHGVSGSAQVYTTGGTIDCTTSWKKFTKTITLTSLAGKTVNAGSYLKVGLWSQGTLNSYIEIAQVQLELGSVATDFEHRSYGEELALCQRYFVKFKSAGLVYNTYSTTQGYFQIPLPVAMRGHPTVSWDTVDRIALASSSNINTNITYWASYSAYPTSFYTFQARSSTSLTAGLSYVVLPTNAPYVALSAEL